MAPKEIGKINKAEFGNIMTKRKAYLVTILPDVQSAPKEYAEKIGRYWQAVDDQISQLESKAGTVKKILVEGVIGRGADAELMLKQSTPSALRIIRSRTSSGAILESYEDQELFEQMIDFGRCLQIGLISKSVSDMIVTKYQEIAEQRLNYQKKIVDEVVLDNEALLLLGSNTQNTLPSDFEKFFISPPELDEISRWINENNKTLNSSNQEADQKSETKQSSEQKDSGLWTPGQGV